MGTNYYLKYKPEPFSDLSDFMDYADEIHELDNGFVWKQHYYPSLEELAKKYVAELHIGKSSWGWAFSLCVYPKLNINTLEDWDKLFDKFEIENECGETISKEDMLDTITNRRQYYKDQTGKELNRHTHLISSKRYSSINKDVDYDLVDTWDYC